MKHLEKKYEYDLYLDYRRDEIVERYSKKWELNKHDTVLKMIDEHKDTITKQDEFNIIKEIKEKFNELDNEFKSRMESSEERNKVIDQLDSTKMKELKSFCERCLKQIKSNDDYHEVRLYLNGKKDSVKYIHNKCHVDMNKQNAGMVNVAGGLMNQLQGLLGKPKGI